MSSVAVPEYRALLPSALLADPDPDAGAVPVRRSVRDWCVDILFFLFSVALTIGATFEGVSMQVSPPMQIADTVTGALLCFGVWVRRRWPIGFALACTAAGFFATSSFGPGLVALFTVVVHRRLRVALAIVAAGVPGALLFPAIRPEWTTGPYWFELVWGAVLTAPVLAWGMFVRARRQLIVSLRERAHRAEAEQQLRVAQARQAERTRIAREMHDVLAHRISLLSLHAGALEYRPDAPAEEVARAAGVIRTSAHQALEDLREVIGVLREDTAGDRPDRPQPTLADLPALVDESREAGMRVRLDQRLADLSAVPVGVGRNAYRIVQEGLTNARKHAHGTAVEVTVDGAPGSGLTVEVRNPLPVGTAAHRIPGAGTGIIGLAERASLAGGRLEHGRTASGHFRLFAWLPWPA